MKLKRNKKTSVPLVSCNFSKIKKETGGTRVEMFKTCCVSNTNTISQMKYPYFPIIRIRRTMRVMQICLWQWAPEFFFFLGGLFWYSHSRNFKMFGIYNFIFSHVCKVETMEWYMFLKMFDDFKNAFSDI